MLTIARHWWVPLLRGVVGIAFGIAAIVMPHVALVSMVLAFGIYAFVDGVVAIAGLFTADSKVMPWYLQLLVGATGILAGIVTFRYPGLTAIGLLSFIAAFALVTGLAELIAAIQQRERPGAVGLGIAGVVSLFFGVLMLARPVAGALALAWLIGVYAIVAGAGSIMMGATLYALKTRPAQLRATMFPAEGVEARNKRKVT